MSDKIHILNDNAVLGELGNILLEQQNEEKETKEEVEEK